MTTTQKVLTDIIGWQLFGSDSEKTIPDGLDWHSVLSEAQQQAVYPIVYSYIEKFLPYSLQDVEYQKYRKRSFSAAALNIRNLHSHTELHKLLSAHDIPYVILKGQASAFYYPDPMLRSMGDVDFLVPQNVVNDVDLLLLSEGFKKIDGAEKHGYHWEYRRYRESLELHWNIPGIPENGNKEIRQYLSDILESRREVITHDGGVILIPSAFHHGLILLLHIISHLAGSGVGLRHLCDWLVFENIFSDGEFRKTFEKPLRDIGLWTFAKVLTKIGIMHFGCSGHEWCEDADETVCNEFLEDIFKGGNFGVKDSTRRSQEKLIQNRRSKKVNSGRLWKNGFTSIDQKAEVDYPVVKKIPELRPFVWLLIVIQYFERVLSGKRNNVFDKKVYSDAMERQALYSKLKLFEN